MLGALVVMRGNGDVQRVPSGEGAACSPEARPRVLWIHSWRAPESALLEVQARVGELWQRALPWSRELAREPGLLLFCRVDEELLEQVRSLTSDGARVIALALGDELPSGDTLRVRSAGACAVLSWGTDSPAQVVARLERWQAVDLALERLSLRRSLVGQSRVWLGFLRGLAEATMFSSAPILLLGESGTGKEQLAHLVHALGGRTGSCVVIDCSTVEPSLSGSEFFGHERGSYTGASGQREGAFMLAHQGTLFLDEVGELPLGLQAQLLRVSQERTYKRLGSNHWFESDFRLVSATHRDLTLEVHQQRFRFDFRQRIGTWTFRVPPLRERPEDILHLAQHFARRLLGAQCAGLTPELGQVLAGRSYPGNVRELEQLLVRLCCRHVGSGPLCAGDLSPEELAESTTPVALREAIEQSASRAVLAGLGLKELLREARAAAIRAALEQSQHNVREAALLLHITDRALQMDLAKREPRADQPD